jgi:UPF0716 protein FxsA
MLLKLLAAFILIPLVELVLLMKVAEVTSIGHTIALVVITGVIGTYVARREGLRALYRFQGALGEGRLPSREIQDGLMIVFAAALLLTPGLLTDAVGFLLLIPPGRELIRRTVLKSFVGRFQVTVINPDIDGDANGRRLNPNQRTIDVEAEPRKPR